MEKIKQSLFETLIKKSPERYKLNNLSELEQLINNASFPNKEKKVVFQMPQGIKLNCNSSFQHAYYAEGNFCEYKAEEFVESYLNQSYDFMDLTDSSTQTELSVLVTPRLILNYDLDVGQSIILPDFPVLIHSKDNVGLPIIDLYEHQIDSKKIKTKIKQIQMMENK